MRITMSQINFRHLAATGGLAVAVMTIQVFAPLSAAAQSPLSGIPASQLRWRSVPGVTVTGNRVRVRIPAGSPASRQRNCARSNFDITPFQNRELGISIQMRGKNVSPSRRRWSYNARLQLSYRLPNGSMRWVEAVTPSGNFNWTSVQLSDWIPAGSSGGIIYLGLDNGSGEIEFNLSTLKISALGEETEQPEAIAPGLARELELIESRMRRMLLSGRIKPEKEVLALIARQRADGTFDGIDYSNENRSQWKTAEHLSQTRAIARAYASENHPLYRDAAVGKAIRNAVNWWSSKRPFNSNWWWNDMWVPEALGETLLLAPDLFPEGPERSAALRVCRQAKFLPRYTGNNRVYIARNIFLRALLERNIGPLNKAAAVLSEEIRFASVENKTKDSFGGIRADGCYHLHGPQVQFGNYGCEFLKNVANWANIWRDTHWQFSPEQWEIIRHLAFNGFRWVLWHGRMDLLACGRQLGRNAPAVKGKATLAAFRLLREADQNHREAYDEVLEQSVDNTDRLVGNRHFWNSDYMVHRRPGWYAAVRMNSVRVRPIEDGINWDNALGRYFSDGVCLITRTGREYDNITAVWNWTRLPGTTLPATPVTSTRQLRWTLRPQGRSRLLGESGFVGGVTDGICGVAVFTMNLDGVKAKKAYFFDSDSVRQLVCGINSTSPFEVATTVNSCLRNGEIRQGPGWFWHDGIGYRGSGMKLTVGMRTGDWRYLEGGLSEPMPVSRELFTLSIEHGLAPRGASCEYTILPGATPEATAAWQGGKTLANTPQLQAVELRDGRIGAVFHAPGRLGTFRTDSPGVFLIGKKEVWAADPAARLNRMKLTLGGVVKQLSLPGGEMAGSSVIVKF